MKQEKNVVECSTLVLELSNMLNEENQNPSANRRWQIEEKFKRLKQYINPTSEFSATARACLKSTGIDW